MTDAIQFTTEWFKDQISDLEAQNEITQSASTFDKVSDLIQLHKNSIGFNASIELLEALSNKGARRAAYLMGMLTSPNTSKINDGPSVLIHETTSLDFLNVALKGYIREESDESNSILADIYYLKGHFNYSRLFEDDDYKKAFMYFREACEYSKHEEPNGERELRNCSKFLVSIIVKTESPFKFSHDLLADVISQGCKSQDPWALEVHTTKERSIKAHIISSTDHRLSNVINYSSLNDTVYESVRDFLPPDRISAIEEQCLAESICELLWQEEPMLAALYISILISDYESKESYDQACSVAMKCHELGTHFNTAALRFANKMVNEPDYREDSIHIIKSLAKKSHPEALTNYGMILFQSENHEDAIPFLSKGLAHVTKVNCLDQHSTAKLHAILAECYMVTDTHKHRDAIFNHLRVSFNKGYLAAGINLAKLQGAYKKYHDARTTIGSVKASLKLAYKDNDSVNPFDDLDSISSAIKPLEIKIIKKIQSSEEENQRIISELGHKKPGAKIFVLNSNDTTH
jgi:tetratricopeptide (TPR) repeat protein